MKKTVLWLLFATLFSVDLQAEKGGSHRSAGSTVVAKFETLSGHVQYKPKGGHWQDAKLGISLHLDTELETGPRSRVILVFTNGSTVALNALSSIVLDKYSTGTYGTQVVMSLRAGRMLAKIPKTQKTDERNYFHVRTPTVVAGVRGTIQEISYSPDRGTEIKMHESASDLVDRARGKTLLPQGGKSRVDKDGTQTADKAANRAQTTTLVSRQASTPGEVDFSYTSGDFGFSPNASDFAEFLRIYDRFVQDSIPKETLILEKL